MALAKYGGGVIELRGSIAGNTYSANRYGRYVRARTKPINPDTPLQTEVRSALAWCVEHWFSSASPEERIAWGDYADKVNMLNKLGEVMHLSGYNHFVRSNSIRKRNANTIVLPGPTTFNVPEHDPLFSFVCDEVSQELTVTFDDTEEWCTEVGAHLYIFVGSPQSPQRNHFAGPWKFGLAVDGVAEPGATSPATVPSPFALAEGQRVWIYGRISLADGRLSEPFRSGPTLVASGA
ncbi:hypothetical protein ES703_112698 [subsurface metagenome]